MKWISYKNINDFDFKNHEVCENCNSLEFNHLIKSGSLLDDQLDFLTYISITSENPNEIIIGSYPIQASDVMLCKNCENYYLKYFVESGHFGKFEFRKLEEKMFFNSEFASCAITINQAEADYLKKNYQIGDFENLEKGKYFFKMKDLGDFQVLNPSFRGENVYLNFLGKRETLHELIKNLSKVSSKRKLRKSIL